MRGNGQTKCSEYGNRCPGYDSLPTPRRQDEFKVAGREVNWRSRYSELYEGISSDAVGIIEPEGLTAAEVSRRLGVNVNVLRVSERLVVALASA